MKTKQQFDKRGPNAIMKRLSLLVYRT